MFQALTDRHETLRTSFTMQNGEPVQFIAEHTHFELEYGEAETYTPEETLKFVRPFDLGRAPLLRVKLIRLKDTQTFVMMFDMHHIISDGMSMNILIREFSRLYGGESLEALRVQYRDYSEWFRQRDLSVQREFWRKEFEGGIPVLDMPLEQPLEKLQIFIDHSSVEIFANGGEATFTSHVYPTERGFHYTVTDGAGVKLWTLSPSVTDEFVV